MAKRDDVFPSKYLKAADLNGKPVTVTIEGAPLETLKSPEGKEQIKNGALLPRQQEGNAAQHDQLGRVADICGDDSDEWPGKRIELYPDEDADGRQDRRLHPHPTAGQRELPAKKPAASAVPAAADMDDEIPF